MNVAIYSQLFGSQHESLLKKLFDALSRHKARIWLHPLFAPVFNLWQQNSGLTYANIDTTGKMPDNLDFIIVLGGDGSFLKAISEFEQLNVPFVGINTGRLGFLADISPDDVASAIDAMAANQFIYETITPDCRQVRDDLCIDGYNNFNYELQRLKEKLK